LGADVDQFLPYGSLGEFRAAVGVGDYGPHFLWDFFPWDCFGSYVWCHWLPPLVFPVRCWQHAEFVEQWCEVDRLVVH
jgi:hypothetical protein